MSLMLLETGLHALSRNMGRSLLTTLGIVIGIGAVVTMLAIGNGSSAAISAQISGMGADSIIVIPQSASQGSVQQGAGTGISLQPGDADALRRACLSIRAVAPIVRARAQLVRDGANWVPETIQGSTPDFLSIRDWTLEEGVAFDVHDVDAARRVCLIGKTVRTELFGSASPIGETLRIRNTRLRVIGVLAEKGAHLSGSDQDDIVLLPWTTVRRHITAGRLASVNQSNRGDSVYPGGSSVYPEQSTTQARNHPRVVRFDSLDSILVAALDTSSVDAAKAAVRATLRERHELSEGVEDDFTIIELGEIMATLTATGSLMSQLLLAVAAISLIVGGVGIMNIMLVSVTERTREIGLRLAVGARQRDVLGQFLVESIVLSMLGAALGLLLAAAATYLVRSGLGWPVQHSATSAWLAVSVSVGIGILFGFYPAWKAARMDPIQALRHE
jgi:ABC-type antimicrobial peptide transport system permease subunit